MSKQIVVDVMDDGEVRIETQGFSGPVCLAKSEFLKNVLGEEVSKQLTPAYYQQDERDQVKRKKYMPLCG